MAHIRDQQRKKDVEPLDLAGEGRGLQCRPVQQFIYGIIYSNFPHRFDVLNLEKSIL